jgi:sulfide:quinone oxidoreductase
MDISQLSPAFSVSGQIQPEDLSELKNMGFRAVICNRPDAETPGQPPVQDIRDAAEKAGLELRYVPVAPAEMSELRTAEMKAADMKTALSELPAPVLGYCGSGKRAARLWSLANADA